jgi:HAD superfamily hydrolase (TIGR01549 family)
MALEAAIFDMDGTMIDSMPYHAQSWREFFKNKGLEVSEGDLKEKGHGTLYDIMPRFFGNHLTRQESYELAMEKESLFRNLYEPFIHPIDGLEKWLVTLRNQHIKVGLGTAADYSNTDFTLDTLGLRHYFDVIVTSDLVPEGKPSPAVYLYAAGQMGVAPEDCLVFEDTFSGVAAGKAAGMKVIALTTMHAPHEWEDKGVDGIISSYHDADLNTWRQLFE